MDELSEIIEKYCFQIHEEYETYKNIDTPYIGPTENEWKSKYAKMWQEMGSNKNWNRNLKYITSLGDIVEVRNGTVYINNWT